jgi:hypothetical protein
MIQSQKLKELLDENIDYAGYVDYMSNNDKDTADNVFLGYDLAKESAKKHYKVFYCFIDNDTMAFMIDKNETTAIRRLKREFKESNG